MDDIRVYNIKWQDDLELFMPVFHNFILEGYINDVYPFRKETDFEDQVEYDYYTLPRHIAERYKKQYCVVFFDHTKSPGKFYNTRPNSDGTMPEPTTDFGTFEFLDKSPQNPNIKFFQQYYTDTYNKRAEETSSRTTQVGDLSRDMRRMREAMQDYPEFARTERLAKPFLFILKNVSRFMVRPGDPRDIEYPPLNLLFQATQLNENGCKLVILLDKMNDLPTWFESENTNHKIKKIYIASPDGDFRQKFFIDKLSGLFTVDAFARQFPARPDYAMLKRFPGELSQDEKREYDIKLAQFEKDGKKFGAFTDDFSVQSLLLLRSFVDSIRIKDKKSPNLDDLQSIILSFKFGKMTNPWKRKDLKETFKRLPSELKKELQGQNEAIDSVVEKLLYAVQGIARLKENDRKPRAILFLVGPTGTGKTEMSKQIAKSIFGSEDSMVRFDMSEFSAEHTDSRLFGAPPGYVGYDAGGELTRAIKQNPFSLILFDEIEKANHKILDKFLQILDDGRLTDGKGETVYFTDCVIVFTSNCGITGFDELKQNGIDIPLGVEIKDKPYAPLIQRALRDGVKSEMMEDRVFNRGGVIDEALFRAFLENTVTLGVEHFFTRKLNPARPELLARIGSDNIIVFNFMNKQTARLLIKVTISKFITAILKEKKISLASSEAVETHIYGLVSDYATLDFGARGIISRVENLLKSAMSGYLSRLPDDEQPRSAVLAMENGKIVIR